MRVCVCVCVCVLFGVGVVFDVHKCIHAPIVCVCVHLHVCVCVCVCLSVCLSICLSVSLLFKCACVRVCMSRRTHLFRKQIDVLFITSIWCVVHLYQCQCLRSCGDGDNKRWDAGTAQVNQSSLKHNDSTYKYIAVMVYLCVLTNKLSSAA